MKKRKKGADIMKKKYIAKKLGVILLSGMMLATLITGCNKTSSTDASVGVTAEDNIESGSAQTSETSEAVSDEVANIITMEYQFYSETEDGLKFEIPDTIEVDGVTYKYTGNAEYQTSEIMSVVAHTVDVEVEEKEDAETKITWISDATGKKYELNGDIFNWSDLVPITTTVTERVEYGARTQAPYIPQVKTISYYNEVDEKDDEISGELVSSGQSEPAWRSGYPVNGVFTASDASVDNWTIEGFKSVYVPQSSPTPTWEGYQSDILTLLGLDPTLYRVTGARWNGDAYTDANGVISRNAIFDCEAYLSTYWAVYEGKGEALGYRASVTYYAYADDIKDVSAEDISTLYKMVAIASYEEVSE